jgi:hypothetical protein
VAVAWVCRIVCPGRASLPGPGASRDRCVDLSVDLCVADVVAARARVSEALTLSDRLDTPSARRLPEKIYGRRPLH